MKINTLQKQDDFKPSSDDLRKWLGTRKSGKKVSNKLDKTPGLFITSSFTIDAIIFFVALGLDVYGLSRIFSYSKSYPVLAGILLGDIVLAIFAHLPRGWIKRYLNTKWLREYEISSGRFQKIERQGDINKAKSQINTARIIEYFFSLIILALCYYKIVTFLKYSGLDFFAPSARFIVLSYILTAGFHLYSTGYFLNALFVEWLFNRSRKKHFALKSLNPPGTLEDCSVEGAKVEILESKMLLNEISPNLREVFMVQIGDESLKPGEIKIKLDSSRINAIENSDSKHLKSRDTVLVKIGETIDDKNIYFLRYWGLIDDYELSQMVDFQGTEESRKELLYLILKVQFDSLA